MIAQAAPARTHIPVEMLRARTLPAASLAKVGCATIDQFAEKVAERPGEGGGDVLPRETGDAPGHAFRQPVAPGNGWHVRGRLTGVRQEETRLLLYPDAADPDAREILFLREPNARLATWEGHKLSKDEARRLR